MTDKKSFDVFPNQHIKPYDGMSITADIWQEAHEEHRQAMRAHELSLHGVGIVQGLEVVANDPADQFVFVSPGIAVDSEGNVVVLQEPVAYDFGDSPEGALFLVIGHGEREIGGVDNEARYMQDEFVIAALKALPKRPAVEIARIQIKKKGDRVRNATDPANPGVGELDLRFRREISPIKRQFVLAGLVNMGGKLDAGVAFGWKKLASECLRSSPYQLVLDNRPEVIKDLGKYDLVYLSGKGDFQVGKTDLAEIKKYHKAGNPIILEALDEKAADACQQLLKDMGVKLSQVDEAHALLESPFMFAVPPAGYMEGQVSVGKAMLYSSTGYSLLWGGKQQTGTPARTDIRSAHEWGINILEYLLKTE